MAKLGDKIGIEWTEATWNPAMGYRALRLAPPQEGLFKA
jgi:protein gp37